MAGQSHTATRGLVIAMLAVALVLGGCSRLDTRRAALPDVNFVIPFGAAAAEMRGEAILAVPPRVELRPGQTIAIRNDDQAMHYFFETPISPGQTLRKSFETPGRHTYSLTLSCSIANTSTLTVDVLENGQ
ncbi:MAG: hypothetical protein U0821_25495 [Chloroflexota bacterium]